VHTALFENITFESLQTRWVCENEGGDVLHWMTVPLAVKTLAKELAVSVKGLRQRMKDVQFDPLQAYSLVLIDRHYDPKDVSTLRRGSAISV
jgi:hypothetical protein